MNWCCTCVAYRKASRGSVESRGLCTLHKRKVHHYGICPDFSERQPDAQADGDNGDSIDMNQGELEL